MRDVFDYLERSDLNREWQEITDLIGIEAVRNIHRNFPSMNLTVSNFRLNRRLLKQYIAEKYCENNINAKLIARNEGISLSYAYDLIKRSK